MDPTIAPVLLPLELLELAAVGVVGAGVLLGAGAGAGAGAGGGGMQAEQVVSVGAFKPVAHEHCDAPALEE